jgi:hypothetical protein
LWAYCPIYLLVSILGAIFEGMSTRGREYQRLTVEDVRKFAGFERRTDEEIKQIIIAVEKISVLIYKKFNKTEMRI